MEHKYDSLHFKEKLFHNHDLIFLYLIVQIMLQDKYVDMLFKKFK
jgi:hypothetical protein